MKPGFTGIADLDKLILFKLNDRDLLNTCLVDKSLSNICNDDTFWKQRFINIFGEDKLVNNNTNKPWKQYYLEIIHDLDIINNNYDDLMYDILSSASIRIGDTYNLSEDIASKLEQLDDRILLNGYFYYTVYDKSELKIQYPIDRYQDGDPIERVYQSENGYTPYQIAKLVEAFYKEPITLEELEEQQDLDNPYAEDYTEEQVENGEITREMMINMFWEQFSQVDEDTYDLNFGS
jgi:hypothetical protein